MVNSKTAEQFATDVVRKLRKNGYVAYFAGGCVRDMLLNVTPKDFDVATNALPEQVREVFGRRKTLAIGLSFGVITVLGPNRTQIEVATFRSDGEYSDGRRPDAVTFSTAEEDALRRDFTINGMFYDPLEKDVIDFVHGQSDLQLGVIRAIGSAAERIHEDRLRMLRGVRFAATYNFEIDADTLAAIQSQHAKIATVSQERVTHELQRMLCHPNRKQAIQLLHKTDLLPRVLPRVDELASTPSRWKRLLQILETLSVNECGLVELPIVLAALWGADGANLSVDQVTNQCRTMKVSNEVRKTVEWIVRHSVDLVTADRLRFSELQPLLIQAPLEAALQLLEAVARVDGSDLSAIEHCRDMRALPPEKLDPAPLIRGEDLAKRGLQPGPDFARLLKLARNAQLDGLVSDKQAALELVDAQR